MARTKKTEETQENEPFHTSHAFSDTTDRHALDALLRKNGFKIYARPNDKPAIWVKGSIPYSECEALATLPRELVRNASYLNDVYLDGKIEE